MALAQARSVRKDGKAIDSVVAQVDDAFGYSLDEQVGFLLRQANQRHHAIFAQALPGLTTRQWAVLAKLSESGPSPQNLLGRRTSMDAATIKGVVDRLRARGLIETSVDDKDARRRTIGLTADGARLAQDCAPVAACITQETLAPLNEAEQQILLRLLRKIS